MKYWKCSNVKEKKMKKENENELASSPFTVKIDLFSETIALRPE